MVFVCLLALPHTARAADPLYEVTVSKFLMGTSVETTARHPDINACRKGLQLAYQEMERVESLLSYHRPTSDVALINASAGLSPVRVSQETFDIDGRARAYAERLDGLFDVSVGALSERWGFSGNTSATVPSPEEIADLLSVTGFRKIVLNPVDTTVFLEATGMKIDLGGIAKGYAIDQGVAVLKGNGIDHFFLNAGGDIHVAGEKARDRPWRVGIRHPRNPEELITSFNLQDHAVATSGDYERFKIIDGQRYHHVLDPRSGYPGPLCQSVTVLAPTAEEADVLAMYLFLVARPSPKVPYPHTIVLADGSVVHGGFPPSADLQFQK